MIETTITGERGRLRAVGLVLRQYLDLVAGVGGTAGALAAIIVIWSWPWALLAGSAALVLVALVMPRWD